MRILGIISIVLAVVAFGASIYMANTIGTGRHGDQMDQAMYDLCLSSQRNAAALGQTPQSCADHPGRPVSPVDTMIKASWTAYAAGLLLLIGVILLAAGNVQRAVLAKLAPDPK